MRRHILIEFWTQSLYDAKYSKRSSNNIERGSRTVVQFTLKFKLSRLILLFRMAFESIKKKVYSSASDVWMLGATIWEILSDCA